VGFVAVGGRSRPEPSGDVGVAEPADGVFEPPWVHRRL